MENRKKFDRSQFKATATSSLKEQDEAVDEKVGSKRSDRIEVIRLKKDKSKNRLRIFPKHPGTNSFMYPLSVHFIKVQKTDKDGKGKLNENGQPDIGIRTVFNASVHATPGVGGAVPKDPIDLYIQAVYKKAYELNPDDEEARKKFLLPITGYRTGGDKWISGLKASTRWMCYGELNGKFGRVELPTTVKNRLNEISDGQEDAQGQPIAVDPFTDPDTGRKVFITFDKHQTDISRKYETSIDLNPGVPIADELFELFREQPTLQSLYVNKYSHNDYMLALEGLKNFEQDSAQKLKQLGYEPYNIFADDNFLDELERLSGVYEDTDEETSSTIDKKDSPATETNTPEKKAIQSNEQDSSLPWEENQGTLPSDLDELKIDDLKEIIKKEKLGIRVLSRYTEDDVRELIRDERALANEELNGSPKERKSRLDNLVD